jgi:hypothetical protein
VPKPTSGWSTPARRGSSTDSSCSESGVVEPRRPAQASKERLRLSESGWARARRLRRWWRRRVSVRRSVSLAGPSVACPKSPCVGPVPLVRSLRKRSALLHASVEPRKDPRAASSVAHLAPVRRAPCRLASHPLILRPPSKDLGHTTLASRSVWAAVRAPFSGLKSAPRHGSGFALGNRPDPAGGQSDHKRGSSRRSRG